jgi:ParB-like chromosome segregation protein Spo0J
MTGMEFHPLANLFPLLEDKELDELAADIRENGLRTQIITFEEKILDGRNRYLACQRADVEPRYREYIGSNPLGLVLSLNLKRRHLDESQRAIIAAKIATLQHGGDRSTGQLAACFTQEQAAEMLNVGERNVRRAREVLDKGVQELVAKVDRGEVSVSAASDVAKLPQEQQRGIVAMDQTARNETLKEIRSQPRSAASQKAAEQTGGPIAVTLTQEQRQHLAGAMASLKMVRARLANNGVHDFTADIDRLIERMTKDVDEATAAQPTPWWAEKR